MRPCHLASSFFFAAGAPAKTRWKNIRAYSLKAKHVAHNNANVGSTPARPKIREIFYWLPVVGSNYCCYQRVSKTLGCKHVSTVLLNSMMLPSVCCTTLNYILVLDSGVNTKIGKSVGKRNGCLVRLII